MAELQQFFSMGGYGAYVWSAYAITFIVLLANILVSRRGLTSSLEHARRMQSTQDNQILDKQA